LRKPWVIHDGFIKIADPQRNHFFNVERLNQFRKVGGVRIEDDIVITKTGYLNLTQVPKEISEIEQLMA
jgi:Xaa-Pro dipeptidase